MVKLDAMENPYRLPDGLRREIGEAVASAEINRYPDPTAPALVKRLRKVMGIAPEYDVSLDRKSTRLNSSHSQISYAVFCLKKKKKNKKQCNTKRLKMNEHV